MLREYMTWEEKENTPLDYLACNQICELWEKDEETGKSPMPEEYARGHTLRIIREFAVSYGRALEKYYHILPKE